MKTLIDLVVRRLPGGDYHSLQDIQILAPMRKGTIGVNNLNTEPRRLLTRLHITKGKGMQPVVFRQGGKVMS